MLNSKKIKLLPARKVSAFTLIEVLIALAVTMIGLVPLLHLLTAGILVNDSAWNLLQATLIADNKLAEVAAVNNTELIDDNGKIEFSSSEITFDWRTEVTEPQIEEFENAALTGLNKVTVTVMWQEGENRKQIALTRYVFADKTVTKSD